MERNWKLGDNLRGEDNLLDPITFDELVLTLHCNARTINEQAARRELREMLETEIRNQNLTHRRLGVRSGMTQSNVSNFVRGERVPRLDVLQRLAHGLGKRLVIRFE